MASDCSIFLLSRAFQRSASSLYAAILEWFEACNHKADAQQIQDEFIAVRQLGGTVVPRLKLNVENCKLFIENVVKANAEDAIGETLCSIRYS